MGTSKVTGHPPTARTGAAADRRDELALVERCRAGDLAAFEELYRTHAGRLFSVACRLLGNPADAEDLLQEIFMAAHRKLDTFRGESALGTWLYRLATNLCLDHLRSRSGRSSQVTDSLDDEPGLFDRATSGLAEQTVTKMDIERALAKLPEGCRAAFVLHDIEGLEHGEVAAILDIAEGTSKSQVHKARTKLRALLTGRPPETSS
jgi:RNA polymerase sigma-70 factor, ECF subfamily